MACSRSASLGVVALAVLGPAAAAAGPAPWVEVKTPTFTVVSDAGEKEARRVALQFEQMQALLRELWPWARFDSSRPITWEQKGRAHPVGIFAERPDRNWVALRTDAALREADAEWENPHLVVFHEYVHLVLHLNFSQLTFGERASGGELPAEQRPLNRLVGRLKEGKAPAEAEREALGDPTALDRELRHYVMERGFHYQRRSMTLRVETGTWTSRPLPEAESLGLRAAFHAAMGRPTEARAMADEALKLDPGCAVAYEAQAMAAYRQHERAEALRILGHAVELPAASDHVHYLYGHLLWDETQEKAGLGPVERSFERAVQMNASYAEAYNALARVMAARGAPADKTFPLAARASQLAPTVVDYKITALRLAASGGDVEGARLQAQALLERAPSDDRPKLTALLRQLEAKAPVDPAAPP